MHFKNSGKMAWLNKQCYYLQITFYQLARISILRHLCIYVYICVYIVVCFSAKHGFLRCVYAASRYKCRKEEALFLKKIAETLSDTRVYSPHCRNVDTQLCSHGSTQRVSASFVLMSVLTATYFCLLKRISLCCWEVITFVHVKFISKNTLSTLAMPTTIFVNLQTVQYNFPSIYVSHRHTFLRQ